jgi:hypothetical protein
MSWFIVRRYHPKTGWIITDFDLFLSAISDHVAYKHQNAYNPSIETNLRGGKHAKRR